MRPPSDGHPLFDSDWYVFRYPDTGFVAKDAYAHFRRVGQAEGRLPNANQLAVGAWLDGNGGAA